MRDLKKMGIGCFAPLHFYNPFQSPTSGVSVDKPVTKDEVSITGTVAVLEEEITIAVDTDGIGSIPVPVTDQGSIGG